MHLHGRTRGWRRRRLRRWVRGNKYCLVILKCVLFRCLLLLMVVLLMLMMMMILILLLWWLCMLYVVRPGQDTNGSNPKWWFVQGLAKEQSWVLGPRVLEEIIMDSQCHRTSQACICVFFSWWSLSHMAAMGHPRSVKLCETSPMLVTGSNHGKSAGPPCRSHMLQRRQVPRSISGAIRTSLGSGKLGMFKHQ